MGSNPIIGTSGNAFYEGKFANTASSIDSACSRIKAHGLPVNLPGSAKWNSSEHAVALYCMQYNFCRIYQTLEVTPVMESGVTDYIWDLEEIIALLEQSAV